MDAVDGRGCERRGCLYRLGGFKSLSLVFLVGFLAMMNHLGHVSIIMYTRYEQWGSVAHPHICVAPFE